MTATAPFITAQLWQRTEQQVSKALASGALQPIATATQQVEDQGISFTVHILERIKLKERAGLLQRATGDNPFLAPEPDLLVGELSPTHRCLLNKFNVLHHHLLIVTRQFEAQEELLTTADLAALWSCLTAAGGLGFYNGGEAAGASQAHKHLQLVPLPIGPGPAPTPISHLLQPGAATVAGLPFRHGLAWLHNLGGLPLEAAATQLQARYQQLLASCGITGQEQPYNLLVTSDWMLLVPRRQERFVSISVNALGFAGSLLVRNQEELALLLKHGPLSILSEVALNR